MFPKSQIERARFLIEEEIRHKKEIEMYGGVLSKGGVIKPVEERPESATSESISKHDTNMDVDSMNLSI